MLSWVLGRKMPASASASLGRGCSPVWVGAGVSGGLSGVCPHLGGGDVRGHPGRSGAGAAGAALVPGSISPTVPLRSYLALLGIDPGRPLVDSLIEN